MVDIALGVAALPKMAVDGAILRGLKLDFRPFSSPGAATNFACWAQFYATSWRRRRQSPPPRLLDPGSRRARMRALSTARWLPNLFQLS
jgi:hypothetical protein